MKKKRTKKPSPPKTKTKTKTKTKGWKKSYKSESKLFSNFRRNERANSKMKIPEPVHFASRHHSSGFSYRELRECDFCTILEICKHYLSKGGGRINARSKTARYLYDCCSEVSAVTKELENRYKNKIQRGRNMQRYKLSVLQEWNKFFGVDFLNDDIVVSKQLSTPETVYKKLKSDHSKILDLNNTIRRMENQLRGTKRKNLEVIDDHHKSSREALEKGYFQMNKQVGEILEKQKEEFMKTLREKNLLIENLQEEVKESRKLQKENENQNEKIEKMGNLIKLRNLEIISYQQKLDGIATKKRLSKIATRKQQLVDGVVDAGIVSTGSDDEEENVVDDNILGESFRNMQQQIFVLTHDNSKLLKIISELEKAKYMQEFYKIKEKIGKMKKFKGTRNMKV